MKITIYNENWHEQNDCKILEIYPKSIHGCLAGFLEDEEEIEVAHVATFDMPEHGLTEEVLTDTDVLVYWSHVLQDEFSDEVARRIQKHVQEGMGLVALHSAHYSKALRFLLGTSMTLRWHHGESERLVVTCPSHPIAQGIPERFDLAKEEMYGEYFDIPKPDDVVFTGWFSGGDVFRSGCTFTRGNGRIFYFQPGHEEYPIYENPIIQRIIKNAVFWCDKSNVSKNMEAGGQKGRMIMENREVRQDHAKLSTFFDHVLEAEEQSQKPIAEIAADIKKAGIDGLEMRLSHLLEKEDEIAKILTDNDMQISCIFEMYEWALKPDYTEAKVQVDMAKKYGAKVILIVPGFLPEDVANEFRSLRTREEIRAYMDQNPLIQNIKIELTKIVNYAETQGIIITLEDFDGFTAPFARMEELLYYMENVPGLKYTLDMGNFAYSDEDVTDAYALLQEYIVHVHCKDRGEESGYEMNKANKGLAAVPVGKGYMPIKALNEKLLTKGYNGFLAIEHFGADDQYRFMIESAAYLKA